MAHLHRVGLEIYSHSSSHKILQYIYKHRNQSDCSTWHCLHMGMIYMSLNLKHKNQSDDYIISQKQISSGTWQLGCRKGTPDSMNLPILSRRFLSNGRNLTERWILLNILLQQALLCKILKSVS